MADEPLHVKQLPFELVAARRRPDDPAPFSCTVAVGASLVLTVLDCRTWEPVPGLIASRIYVNVASGQSCRAGTNGHYLHHPVPKWAADPKATLKALAKAEAEIGRLQKLPALQQSLAKNKKLLTAARKERHKHINALMPRYLWVTYVQSALSLLDQYTGPINGTMDGDTKKAAESFWKAWRGIAYNESALAKWLEQRLKGRFTTDDDGRLLVPLPADTTGTVTIEFHHCKALHPDEIGTLRLQDRTGADDGRVDYDLSTPEAADLQGSKEERSGWSYILEKKAFAFRNRFVIHFDTNGGEGIREPLPFTTLALVWCQPAWTVVKREFIYDPPIKDGPLKGGFYGRGLSKPDLLPTLLVSTMGLIPRSKMYGEYGKAGRLRLHGGVDIGGNVGDRVFAPGGGEVTYADDLKEKGGNSVMVLSWQQNDELPQAFVLLHFRDLLTKLEQIVKAGDIIARMGRTGVVPDVSPTHTHVQTTPLKALLRLPVFPNNDLPKLLPCQGQYGNNVSAAGNALHCNFQHKSIPATCFAVRELACPFIPKVVTSAEINDPKNVNARRRLQAQLNWWRDKSKVMDQNVDGVLGDIARIRVLPKAKSRKVISATDSKKWFIADKGARFPAVSPSGEDSPRRARLEDSHVKHYAQAAKAKDWLLKPGDEVRIETTESAFEVASATRRDIQAFRNATIDKGSPKDQDAPECYEPSDAMLKELDTHAPLRPQTPRV